MSGLAPSPGLFVESAGSGWVRSSHMAEDRLGPHLDVYLGKAEVGIYCVLAALLMLTALATMVSAGRLLWEGLSHAAIAAQTLRVLDELLVALMLVEILHTVRISIRSHVLVTEPFLVIGLIALIRRIGDQPGTGHPYQTRGMVELGREPFSGFYD